MSGFPTLKRATDGKESACSLYVAALKDSVEIRYDRQHSLGDHLKKIAVLRKLCSDEHYSRN